MANSAESVFSYQCMSRKSTFSVLLPKIFKIIIIKVMNESMT